MTNEVFANSPEPGRVEPVAVLAGNGGQVSATATSWNIEVELPAALQSGGQFHALIDSELVVIPTQAGTTLAGVTRAVEGSTAAVHLDGASIYPLLTAAALTAGITQAARPSVVSVPYASAITPTLPAGNAIFEVGQITGALTVNAPSGIPFDGQIISFRCSQDATGHAVMFATGVGAYDFGTDVTQALVPTGASVRWEQAFRYRASSQTWRALAITRGFNS